MKLIQFALLLSHIGRILASLSGEVSWYRTRDANLWKTYHPKAPSINVASDSEEPTNIYKKIQETFSNIVKPQNQIVEGSFGVDVVLMDLKQQQFVEVMEVVKRFNQDTPSPVAVPKQFGLFTGKADYWPTEPDAAGAAPAVSTPPAKEAVAAAQLPADSTPDQAESEGEEGAEQQGEPSAAARQTIPTPPAPAAEEVAHANTEREDAMMTTPAPPAPATGGTSLAPATAGEVAGEVAGEIERGSSAPAPVQEVPAANLNKAATTASPRGRSAPAPSAGQSGLPSAGAPTASADDFPGRANSARTTLQGDAELAEKQAIVDAAEGGAPPAASSPGSPQRNTAERIKAEEAQRTASAQAPQRATDVDPSEATKSSRTASAPAVLSTLSGKN